VVLFSWRRIGKTALLKCFLTDIVNEGGMEALFIDLMGTRDISSALRRITQAVYDSFGESTAGISVAFRNLLAGLVLN